MKVITAFFAAAFLSGCVVSPYGSDSEQDIRELVRRTNEVVADGDRGRLSLAESRQFLRQSQARLEVLRTRDSGMSKKAMSAVDALDAEYQKLLAENRPLHRRETADLRRLLFALQDLRPVPSVFRRESSGPPSDDNTSNDTATKTDDEKKHCPDKNKRDNDGECRKHR